MRIPITEAYKQVGSIAAKYEVVTNVNLPNFLTVSRILLIPVFVVLFSSPTPGRSLSAAIVFVVAAITDLLDGYLARRRSQVTKLGRLLDPIADKLLVLSGLILLVQFDRVGALVAILIIAREVAVTGIRAIAASEGIILAPETTGKYKMVAQVVAIVMLILEDGIVPGALNLHLAGTAVLYLALILAFISGGRYLVSFWRQVSIKGLW
ncbi:MAG TPA: CDP-diacylglycerol--glycerol-3-phosphate 3-phosphatidyltransferase [Nitrospiraceae bacterium]|nr:CDP-diacylglycerol--glycerol-3-phosphate 3-phosphatidyltransferase [Nitrospiraceae bacterium]